MIYIQENCQETHEWHWIILHVCYRNRRMRRRKFFCLLLGKTCIWCKTAIPCRLPMPPGWSRMKKKKDGCFRMRWICTITPTVPSNEVLNSPYSFTATVSIGPITENHVIDWISAHLFNSPRVVKLWKDDLIRTEVRTRLKIFVNTSWINIMELWMHKDIPITQKDVKLENRPKLVDFCI